MLWDISIAGLDDAIRHHLNHLADFGILMVDREWKIVRTNRGASSLLGAADDLAGVAFQGLLGEGAEFPPGWEFAVPGAPPLDLESVKASQRSMILRVPGGVAVECRGYFWAGSELGLVTLERRTQVDLRSLETMTQIRNEFTTSARELSKKNAELLAANETITRLLNTDDLTGIPNRRKLRADLHREVSFASRHGAPLCLLYFDLDYFKRVNDQLGHDAGDRVLAAFAGRLRELVRVEDHLGRIGGEEFVAVLPGTELSGATALAERIRASMHLEPVLPELLVTVSVGVAEWIPEEDIEQFLKRADEALYGAKGAGRDRVVS